MSRCPLTPALSQRERGKKKPSPPWGRGLGEGVTLRRYPTLVIAHFTCCGPSIGPVSTTCSLRLGSGPPR